MKDSDKTKEKELSYSQAMEKINAILEKLNNEELDIDTLSAEVKQATELIAYCRKKLRTAQEQVEEVFNTES